MDGSCNTRTRREQLHFFTTKLNHETYSILFRSVPSHLLQKGDHG